jgi:tetratricopeptide (TPR) repeat protein
VIEASQRDFFRDYLEQPDIPNRDKAELLYMVLFAYHQAAQYQHVPEVAHQIFALIGYESELAMKAAYGIPLGLWLRKQNKEAVEQYELFLRAFPKAPDVAEASLGLARSRHELGDMAGALLQYGLTAEMYPGTSAGKEAKSVYESLLGHDAEGKWIAEANRRRPDVVARLNEPISPAEAWPIRPPKSAVAKAEAPKKETESRGVSKGPDPRFVRLSALEWKIESDRLKKQQ